MLEKVKLAIRYKNALFDNEILMYISSCKKQLLRAGILENKIIDTDESIVNTVIAYVKWQINFQGRGNEWEKIYKDLRLSLTLDSNYINVQ